MHLNTRVPCTTQRQGPPRPVHLLWRRTVGRVCHVFYVRSRYSRASKHGSTRVTAHGCTLARAPSPMASTTQAPLNIAPKE
jgi:hypothetical protein